MQENPIALAFSRGQGNLIADWLQGISTQLKAYEGDQFKHPILLLEIAAAEFRKRLPQDAQKPAQAKKPLPGKMDPNSMIPRPVTPPRGSGPVRLSA